MHPGDRHYRNQVVRLPDLAVTTDVIQGVTFENCTIVGPAVVVMAGNGEMRGTSLDGDPDAFLWPVGNRDRVIGVIVLVDCTIVGCRLQRIGLAYPPEQEASVRAGFGLI